MPGSLNVRAGLRIGRLLAVLAACLIGWAAAVPFGREQRWVRRFLGAAARSLGADVTVVGQPLPCNVLFVANHLSWFDILAIGGATGAAFVSKDAVAHWPVVGTLARIGGTIFIARESRAAARGQADALAETLASGRPAAFFPEGTTGDGHALLPFRAALFAAVPASGAAVQPIAIDYGVAAPEIAWGEGEGAGANALRLLGRRGRLGIRLRFLEPIDPAGLDRKALAALARERIAAALGE